MAHISQGRQLHTVKMQMLGNKCWEQRGKGLQPPPPGAGTQLSFSCLRVTAMDHVRNLRSAVKEKLFQFISL